MASNLVVTQKRLLSALNSRGYRLAFGTRQFWGIEDKPINYYSISQAVWDEEKGRYTTVELYSSASLVRIVLFLRDMWYTEIGKELPTDQEKWNSIRKEINNG